MDYLAGKVQRYHTDPWLSGQQTDADHSWGVAVIANYLYPDASKNLILAALLHDVGERYAGDLPYNFKKNFPAIAKQHSQVEENLAHENGWRFPELTEEELKILKICDRIEAFLFAQMKFRGTALPRKWVEEQLALIKEAKEYPTEIRDKIFGLLVSGIRE